MTEAERKELWNSILAETGWSHKEAIELLKKRGIGSQAEPEKVRQALQQAREVANMVKKYKLDKKKEEMRCPVCDSMAVPVPALNGLYKGKPFRGFRCTNDQQERSNSHFWQWKMQALVESLQELEWIFPPQGDYPGLRRGELVASWIRHYDPEGIRTATEGA